MYPVNSSKYGCHKEAQAIYEVPTVEKCLPLTLEDNGDMHVIKWLANGSYGVHPDMKSDTGATISLGK